MLVNRKDHAAVKELDYDVVVIGGGIAGVSASCAAAAAGSRTLLVESSGALGAVVTMGPLEALMTQYDAERKVIGGIADELISGLRQLDPSAGNVPDTTGYCSRIVPYRSEAMKLRLLRMLEEHKADYLLETMLSGVELKDGKISSAYLHAKTGAMRVHAKAFVDCSGYGILGYLAGNDIMVGDDSGSCQPVSVLTRWDGIDRARLVEYVRSHMQDFKSFDGELDLSADKLHLWGFSGALYEGWKNGELSLKRDEIHVMESTVNGEFILNYSRVNIDPWDPFEMSRAQLEGSEQVLELLNWFRKSVPGFENAEILQSGYVGVRESGRIKGRRILTKEDILAAEGDGTGVAMGAFPIDIHKGDSGMQCERVLKAYSIPAAVLIAESVSNLFMGGRCISSSFEANGSCRISLTCAATGQAAGVMAALMAQAPEKWTIKAVQEKLLEQHAIIQ